MSDKLACIILAAGQGSRMKSSTPKPMHPIAGKPMIRHVIDTCKELSPDKIITIVSPDTPELEQATSDTDIAVQTIANGTGGAALAAKDALNGFDGDILIVYGDTPLIRPETLRTIISARHMHDNTGVVYSAFDTPAPFGYGRMVLNQNETLLRIVEEKDADDTIRRITLCNGGIVCARGDKLFYWLSQVKNHNAQGEYYLVDLPEIARQDGMNARTAMIPETETAGVNSRRDQARVETLFQTRKRLEMMENGVTLIDPETAYFSFDTQIEPDVTIGPNVVFGTGVHVDSGVVIEPFCHLAGVHIQTGATIGPFARLRPGTDIGKNAKVGNFVEMKNTSLGEGAKAGHLSYLGDATIGAHVNIGAGTITCNYDGYNKHHTTIGDGTFIGSNTALVAPININKGALVAAGSTITADVDQDAMAFARARQTQKEGAAKIFRDSREKK